MSDEKEEYRPLPIELLIKFGKNIPIDVYLKLSGESDKLIKLSHKEEDFVDTFVKYQKKGIKQVYAKKEDCIHFLQKVKEGIQNQFFNFHNQDEKLLFLDKTYEMIKGSLKNIGINEELVNLCQVMANNTIRLMREQSSLFQFFLNFKDKCGQEFISNILVGYTTTLMLNNLSWSSDIMKEKSNMAAFLRDISAVFFGCSKILSFNFFKSSLFSSNSLKSSGSSKMSRKKKFSAVPQEVVIIIEQHHERPDGKGFPLGITHLYVTPLSAIHIVADDFISLMIRHNFEGVKKGEILNALRARYHQGNFRKALDALLKVLNPPAH